MKTMRLNMTIQASELTMETPWFHPNLAAVLDDGLCQVLTTMAEELDAQGSGDTTLGDMIQTLSITPGEFQPQFATLATLYL